jgi:hypothetical protein
MREMEILAGDRVIEVVATEIKAQRCAPGMVRDRQL